MIQLAIDYCAIECVPVKKSKFHRVLRRYFGKEVAMRLTYEVRIPPDEVEPCSTTLSKASST